MTGCHLQWIRYCICRDNPADRGAGKADDGRVRNRCYHIDAEMLAHQAVSFVDGAVDIGSSGGRRAVLHVDLSSASAHRVTVAPRLRTERHVHTDAKCFSARSGTSGDLVALSLIKSDHVALRRPGVPPRGQHTGPTAVSY
jgi:hypothetical protein